MRLVVQEASMAGRVGIALIAKPEDCVEAANRIVDFSNAYRYA